MRCSHARCKNEATPGMSTCEPCRLGLRLRTLVKWRSKDECPRCSKPERRNGQEICDACCDEEIEKINAQLAASKGGVAAVPEGYERVPGTGALRRRGKGRF